VEADFGCEYPEVELLFTEFLFTTLGCAFTEEELVLGLV